MNKIFNTTFYLILLFFTSRAFSQGLPPSSVNEEAFYRTVNKFEAIYKPIISSISKKKTLVIDARWNFGDSSAQIFTSGNFIILEGGFAKLPGMTIDSLSISLCHELGHMTSSAPRIPGLSLSTPSSEGQSDYYSTLKCLRKLWAREDNIAEIKNASIPEEIDHKCSLSFPGENEKAICIRSILAAQSITNVLAQKLGQEKVDFTTPDYSIAKKTIKKLYDYPSTQCRLDTMIAGALCPVDQNVGVSSKDPTTGTCSEEKNDSVGFRPRCWYKPIL
ncbi:MAG: hypothetical protein ACOYL6_14410 [Bacteriovoracaceae bacterium]